jgi:hypothetical protein
MWCPIMTCTLWPYRFGCRPESARQRYGEAVVTPDMMPGANVALESLPMSAAEYGRETRFAEETARYTTPT